MEMKTLNGYELVDAKAREDIELLKAKEPDLSEYVTENELEQKGYLTEHQSLENYATNESVKNSIDAAIENIDVDLTDYYTKEEIDDGYCSKGEIDSTLSGIEMTYATIEYVDNLFENIKTAEGSSY